MDTPIIPVSSQTLILAAPTRPESAPASVQFSRFREVEIPWLDLIDPDTAANLKLQRPVNVPLRSLEYFEGHWRRLGLFQLERDNNNNPTAAGLTAFDAKIDATADGSIPTLSEGITRGIWGFRDLFVDTTAAAPTKEMFCIFLPLPGGTRIYVPIKTTGGPVTKAEFAPPNPAGSNNYANVFTQLQSIDVVAWQLAEKSTAALDNVRMSAYFLDFSTAEILEDFHRADALEVLAKKLRGYANDKALADETVLKQLWESDEESANFSNRLLRAASLEQRSRAIKLHLSAVAKERGYVLPLEEIKVRRPDVADDKPDNEKYVTYKPGNIYKERTVIVHWEVTEKRTVYARESGMCGGSSTPSQVDVKVPKQAPMLVYDEIGLGQDPSDKDRERLAKAGFSVFDAFEEDAGWVLNDKSSLELLIARCDRDESFRAKCAVILHYRQTKPMGLYPQSTALVVRSPLPGTGPSIFPRVYLREALSYNLMWTGAELGPLVSSINLAPGEERTITASRSFSEEVSESISRKSLLEESSSYTEDFSSQLEKEFTNELSKNSSSSTSVGLSASYMGVGGSFGQTNSSSTGLKNTSRELTRIARKTAQSFNRKAQSEMTVTSTRKQTVQSSEGRTSTVKNVNTGRTLNLLIYQINNRFEGGIFLNDLEVTVQESTELIAGTGIYPRKTVRLHELEKIVPLLDPNDIPLPTRPLDINQTYWRKLSKALLDAIEDEYERDLTAQGGDYSGRSASAVCIAWKSVNAWREKLRPLAQQKREAALHADSLVISGDGDIGRLKEEAQNANVAAKQAEEQAKISGMLEQLKPSDVMTELKNILESIIVCKEPLDRELLIVASGALHMDSLVGLNPATEPYAEQMRELERAKTAMGVEYLAIKNRILSGAVTNYITQVETTTLNGTKYLHLQLKEAITQLADYDVYYKGDLAGGSATLKIESGSGRGLVMEWVGGDVPTKADLEKYLVIIHTPTRNRIFFLGGS